MALTQNEGVLKFILQGAFVLFRVCRDRRTREIESLGTGREKNHGDDQNGACE